MPEERWNQVAAQICDERDPKRFSELVDELNSLIVETQPDSSAADRATPEGSLANGVSSRRALPASESPGPTLPEFPCRAEYLR